MELINSLSWTIGAFVLVIGIMIFVHELGHHLMAKFLGIRVDVFSLGFGPRLFGFKSGETDYRVSLLPLGGYVRMAGENFDEDLTGSAEEFLSRPKLHRFAVAIAGPLMNILLAILLLSLNYMVGIQVPIYLNEPAVIGHIRDGSPAAATELEIGDRILAVNGDETPDWESLNLAVATSPNQQLSLKVEHQGRERTIPVVSGEDESTGAGFLGVSPPVSNVITQVEPGSPAAEANLASGDQILKIEAGGESAEDLEQILDLIGANEGQPVHLTLRRGDQIVEKSIAPALVDGNVRLGIGIAELQPQETREERFGFLAAIGKSIERNYQMTALTFHVIGKLVTGTTSLKAMSGPIEIARVSGQAASHGIMTLIAFMAMVSLQLGIFNLFPIPILDGGVIALLAVEGLMGRDLSLRVKERIFQVGFLFLILLMGIVIFNDIVKNI